MIASHARQQRLVLVVFGAFLFSAASAEAQRMSRRIGIGAAISDVHSIFATAAVNTTHEEPTTPSILIPIQITDRFRIEPEIAVFRHRYHEPADQLLSDFSSNYSLNGMEIGAGIFPQTIRQNLRLYYGVRVGYLRAEERQQETVSMRGIEITQTTTQMRDGFMVAPAVGGEYLLSDRFSIGAEVQFRHASIKGSEVSTLTGLPPGLSVAGAPDEEPFNTSVSATRVLFVTRFYF